MNIDSFEPKRELLNESFLKKTRPEVWGPVATLQNLTLLNERSLGRAEGTENKYTNKGLWGSHEPNRKKESRYLFLLLSKKMRIKFTLAVNVQNNQRATQWLKRTQLTPLHGWGGVKGFS